MSSRRGADRRERGTTRRQTQHEPSGPANGPTERIVLHRASPLPTLSSARSRWPSPSRRSLSARDIESAQRRSAAPHSHTTLIESREGGTTDSHEERRSRLPVVGPFSRTPQ